MTIRRMLALRGPNLWSQDLALEIWVEDDGRQPPPGLLDRLRVGRDTPTPEPSGEAEALAIAVRGLLAQAGERVALSLTRPTTEPGVFRVVVGYEEEAVARAAVEEATAWFDAERRGEPYDLDAAIERLRQRHQAVALGPSTRSIVEAAQRRGIPARRLSEGSLVQLGQGARARRILAAETDRTGAIAEFIAQDKDLTRALLRTVGVPVPEGRPVASADDAWEAAIEVGPPVVVKPRYGGQGRGVATGLTTREQVAAAYQAALAESSDGDVIVERFAPGDDYRVLVVGERVVAAARREPAQVVGDGVHTVAELVEAVNRDPRRGRDHATALSPIPLDATSLAVLASQGYALESVPPEGAVVLIRRNANLSTGGTATDVTDRVHPEVAARCVEAARMVGLDIAGVDVVARDIGRPLEEQGGIIVEVNASPGLRMHLEPSRGRPRDVGAAIIDRLFAPGQTGRIPVVAITGVNGKTTTTRLVGRLLEHAGHRVGLACTDGIYIDGRRIDAGDCSGPASARAVLGNPLVEAAVLETARGGILRAGLGFDRCDVAIVTNIASGDHLGLSDVNTPEELARVKGTIVANVAPGGAAVLNANDPLTAAMAERCPGSVVFFAADPEHPVVRAHRTGGGRAVVVRDGRIVLIEGTGERALCRLAEVPLTRGGRIGFQVENVLAATAAAWVLGLGLDDMHAGLASFASEVGQTPGRFNVLDYRGGTVVVDYGHNEAALHAIIAAVGQIRHRRRSIVFAAAGDRRDVDIIRQGAILGDGFDRVVLYEDEAFLRGRADGAIFALFRQGLAGGCRVGEVHEVRGTLRAVEFALRSIEPDELIVVHPDPLDATLDLIGRLVDEARDEPAEPTPLDDVPLTEIGLPARAVRIGE
jgi:cyanophycin synthetase